MSKKNDAIKLRERARTQHKNLNDLRDLTSDHDSFRDDLSSIG